VDNEEEDTVTFDMVNTFIFRPDLTAAHGLTGDEIVTVPHLLIMVSWSQEQLFSVHVSGSLSRMRTPAQSSLDHALMCPLENFFSTKQQERTKKTRNCSENPIKGTSELLAPFCCNNF
jgi:hypothetical protein